MFKTRKIMVGAIACFAVSLLCSGLNHGLAAENEQEKIVVPGPSTGNSPNNSSQGSSGNITVPESDVTQGGAVIHDDTAEIPRGGNSILNNNGTSTRNNNDKVDDSNGGAGAGVPPNEDFQTMNRAKEASGEQNQEDQGQIGQDQTHAGSTSISDLLPTPASLPEKSTSEKAAAKNGKSNAEKPKSPEKEPSTPSQPQKPDTKNPKAGDKLTIPPDAAPKGDVSFLEGCWQGTRPEYHSGRTIKECFCFQKNGRGKRHIKDSAYAGECWGITQGQFTGNGNLVVGSTQGYCTKGAVWGRADMVCQGSGENTQCYWEFPDAQGGTQKKVIPFVRVAQEECAR